MVQLSSAIARSPPIALIPFLYLAFADVPDAPGRPLVTGFTSRSIDLSWAKPRKQSKEAPITGYSIVTG